MGKRNSPAWPVSPGTALVLFRDGYRGGNGTNQKEQPDPQPIVAQAYRLQEHDISYKLPCNTEGEGPFPHQGGLKNHILSRPLHPTASLHPREKKLKRTWFTCRSPGSV